MDRISIIHLTWKRYVQKQLAQLGITPKQLFLLRRLRETEFLSPSQMARLVFCDRPTVTIIIRNLEKRGWVRACQDPDNRRQKRVAITPRGKAKLESIPGRCFQIGSTTLDPFEGLSGDELRALNELLRRVVRHQREQLEADT
jgi:DNA-binding MarR family transcriptional regulator